MEFIKSKTFENILVALMVIVQLILLAMLLITRESLTPYQIISTSSYIIFVAFYLIYVIKKRRKLKG